MQQQQPERVLLPELELLVPQQRVVPAAAAPVAPPAAAVKPRLTLSWAGSGIFFWWQLGAVQYLAQQFRLGGVPMVGASGGGLAAVLATCEVEPEAVMDSAYRLASEHRIWERPLGLMGTWGGIIEHWLDELLPANAAERCRGQVGIVVTQLPSCRQLAISDFADKEDLINVAMASAHVPIFLDWKVRALLFLLLLPFQPSRLQHIRFASCMCYLTASWQLVTRSPSPLPASLYHPYPWYLICFCTHMVPPHSAAQSISHTPHHCSMAHRPPPPTHPCTTCPMALLLSSCSSHRQPATAVACPVWTVASQTFSSTTTASCSSVAVTPSCLITLM